MPIQPLALSINDTAAALSCGRDSVYKLIEQGRLRGVRIGDRTVVPMSSIRELLGESEAPQPSVEEVALKLLELVGIKLERDSLPRRR